jgi:putative Mg2+ transporter-C (MgtC) family protein
MPSDVMPLHPTWPDIAVRLLLTFVAGALVGLNRQAGGHGAGFRTTVLVGLAACLAMIQANLLLSVGGKTDQSFSVMDVLRFPLGVLTGVGFIGGGAILKRGNLVTGVTTAATMWIMTAIGLCFGGGQVVVGTVATAICLVVLGPLKVIDHWMRHEQKGRVVIQAPAEAIPDLRSLVGTHIDVRFTRKTRLPGDKAEFSFELRWKARGHRTQAGALITAIEQRYQVVRIEIADETD